MTQIFQTTEKYFASTELEAESLLEELKEDNAGSIKNSAIDKKVKKEEVYFIVTVTIEHASVKEILE